MDFDINKKFEFKAYIYYSFEDEKAILKIILINLKLIFKPLRLNVTLGDLLDAGMVHQ